MSTTSLPNPITKATGLVVSWHTKGGIAAFSLGLSYRYYLERQVSSSEGAVVFVMLNPSTADAHADDPTIRKCTGFVQKLWPKRGRLVVVNLFALRATSPKTLKKARDPVGPLNRKVLDHVLAYELGRDSTTPIVCAWGTHGGMRVDHEYRDTSFLNTFTWAPLLRLGAPTKGEHPRHPLYLSYKMQPEALTGPSIATTLFARKLIDAFSEHCRTHVADANELHGLWNIRGGIPRCHCGVDLLHTS